MNVCLDKDGKSVSGTLNSTNSEHFKCTINAGGNEKGFTLKCGEKDVQAKLTDTKKNPFTGEITFDGKTAEFTA